MYYLCGDIFIQFMELVVDKRERFCIVRVNGTKLMSSDAPVLKTMLHQLSSEGFKNIILDLADIQYIDSSGLSALLIGNKLSVGAGGSFVPTNINPPVQKLIRLSQLESVLTFVPTLSEAIDFIIMEELERDLRNTH